MNENKKWYLSKTILAGLTVILVPILSQIGIETTSDELTDTINLVSGLITAVAGIVAVYGRATGTTKITK